MTVYLLLGIITIMLIGLYFKCERLEDDIDRVRDQLNDRLNPTAPRPVPTPKPPTGGIRPGEPRPPTRQQ